MSNRVFGPLPSRWLEVFVVGAYTALPGELAKLAQCVDRKYIEELNAENLLEESLTGEKLYYKVANEPSV